MIKKFKFITAVLLSILMLMPPVSAEEQEICLLSDWIFMPSRVRTPAEKEEYYRRELRGEDLSLSAVPELYPQKWVKIVYDVVNRAELEERGVRFLEVPEPTEAVTSAAHLGNRAFEYYNFTKDGKEGFDLPGDGKYKWKQINIHELKQVTEEDGEGNRKTYTVRVLKENMAEGMSWAFRNDMQYRRCITIVEKNPFDCIVEENGEAIIHFKKSLIVKINPEDVLSMTRNLTDMQIEGFIGTELTAPELEEIWDRGPEVAASHTSVFEILLRGGLVLVITGGILFGVRQYRKVIEEKRMEEEERSSKWNNKLKDWISGLFRRGNSIEAGEIK
jgi:hypothetical protein